MHVNFKQNMSQQLSHRGEGIHTKKSHRYNSPGHSILADISQSGLLWAKRTFTTCVRSSRSNTRRVKFIYVTLGIIYLSACKCLVAKKNVIPYTLIRIAHRRYLRTQYYLILPYPSFMYDRFTSPTLIFMIQLRTSIVP